MAKAPGFSPNFDAEHSVTLSYPLSTVFPALGHGDKIEASFRLSDLASGFDLLKADTVALSRSLPLARAAIRTIPASDTATKDERLLPRQHFLLEETVPVIFGLIKTKVQIYGTLTCDEEAKVALYESFTDGSGIQVWKLRKFEEIQEGEEKKTMVRERIEGVCPKWIRGFVESTTRDALKCVSSSQIVTTC
jgi:hypothetical protein